MPRGPSEPRTVHESLLLEPQVLHGFRSALRSFLLLCQPVPAVQPGLGGLLVRHCTLVGSVPLQVVWGVTGAIVQVQGPGMAAHCCRGGALRGVHLQQRLQQHLHASTGIVQV